MLDQFFNLGSVIILIATLPNIYSAVKDRNELKGYNLFGSIGTALAILVFLIYAVHKGYWLGLITDSATFFYWVLVSIYVWKNK